MIVTVVEAPVIDRIAFEGNSKLKDEQLQQEIQSKPRGTLSKAAVQADVTRIIEVYHRNGRFDVQVVPKIVSGRTIASTWSSKSGKVKRPASDPSSSSAITPIRIIGSRR